MPFRRVSYLELGWFIVRQKIRDLLGCDREDPREPVFNKLPDGTFLVTHKEKEKRNDRK